MRLLSRVFLVGLAVYLSSYAVFGDVLGRNDLTDKAFHLDLAQHPLTFTHGYYAPLLHLITYPLTFVMPVELAFSIVVPFILFLLLPIGFALAWSAFNFCSAEVDDAIFYILFVAYIIPFCILNCTWAQALNLALVLSVLGLMFLGLTLRGGWKNDQFDLLVVVSVFLGFFSHSAGGLWLLGIFLVYLALRKAWVQVAITLAILFLTFYFLPVLFVRPTNAIASMVDNVRFAPWELARIVFLWINPLAVLLVGVGMVQRWRGASTNVRGARVWDRSMLSCDALLLSAVALGVFAIPFDSEYRSILSVMCLLGLYGVNSLQKSKWLKLAFVIWQTFWFILLAFGLVVSYTI
jgi:hypothetical protein